MPPVVMRDPDGNAVEVTPEQVDLFARRGYILESSEQAEKRFDEQYRQEAHGGYEDKVTALRAGLGSGVTAGLSDLVPKSEALKEKIKANEGYHTAGQVAGAVGSILVPGAQGAAAGRIGKVLSKSPAAAIERLAERAGARAGGGIKGAAARGVTEGALHGAGSGITELSLSDDPVTLERAISTISSNALLGGGIGAAGGVFAKAAGKGLKRATEALEARRAAPSTGTQVVDDLAAYAKAREGAFLVAKGERKAVLSKQARRIRDALDAPETLAKRPQQLAATLEKETKVLREILEEGQEETLQKLVANDRKVEAEVSAILAKAKPDAKSVKLPKKLAAEYRDMLGLPGRGGMNLQVEKARDFVQRLEAGEMVAARREALDAVPDMLEQNLAIREAIDESMKKKGALDGLAQQAATSYGVAAVTGLLPGGMLGAAGAMIAPRIVPRLTQKLDDLVTKRLARAGAEAADRTSLAVARVLSAGEKTRRAAAPASTLGATKILQSVSYSPELPASQTRQYAPTGDKLTQAFRNREQEILSQVQAVAPGEYRMRPAARQEVSARLAGARAVDPVLADRIETLVARRVEYLASKMPRRPDHVAMTVGPDRWRPSDMQMRQFARHVQAVEDPNSVIERAADGKVTMADVEALREVYPEQLRDLQRQIVEQLPQVRESLPYEKRLAISILTGVPVVPATDPRILRVLQAQYATEPGTDGGAHAPQAKPQFGSVSRQALTPAQERQNPGTPA